MGIQLRQSEDWNRSATEASKSPPAFISADKGPFAAPSDEQLWQVIIFDAYVNGWVKNSPCQHKLSVKSSHFSIPALLVKLAST